MAGALLQLVAYGAQDSYLTGSPEITYWKAQFKRHTNFAMESIEQTFSGQADFGRFVTCPISRNGDLAYRTYLQITLPEINQSMVPLNGRGVYARWLDYIGEHIIDNVEIEIGGQKIDKQYGDWMHIWNQLTLTTEQQRGYFKMIGNTTQLTYITDPTFAEVHGPCSDLGGPNQVCTPRNALAETTLYIPLQFWFMKNPGLALPLIALQFHEVKINIQLRPIGECLWAVSNLGATSGVQTVPQAYNQSLVAASLYVDYIFLDVDERRRVAQSPHEYLIEQLQYTGDESVGSSSTKLKLSFNHPCKELIWVVQPDANVDYCSSMIASNHLFKTLGAQPFNYTDGIDALPNAIHAFGGPKEITGTNGFITSNGYFQMPGANDYDYYATNPSYNVLNTPTSMFNTQTSTNAGVGGSYVSDAGTFVLSETALDMHCWGENPVIIAKLQLNGQDRISEREGALTSSSHSSTTAETQTPESTSTPSPSSQRSSSQAEPATSRASTTPSSSSFSVPPPSPETTPPRPECMPPAIMSCVL
jgi:Major capsid protein N-terminus/Large eukaryotic DNA virus major capsid protein